MIRSTATALYAATRQLLINRKTLVMMITLYALLLSTIYLFVTTKEATAADVVITIALVLVAPVVFFVLQSAVAGYASGERQSIFSWIRNSWKLFLISLPVIGGAIIAVYLLRKLQVSDPSGGVVLTSLRYLLLGVIAPLILIQLWISANHNGLRQTIKQIAAQLRSAFAARSVLIYMAGFVVFALIPYLLLFKTTAVGGAWLQISLFAIRMIAAFLMILLGWIVTVGALSVTETVAETA